MLLRVVLNERAGVVLTVLVFVLLACLSAEMLARGEVWGRATVLRTIEEILELGRGSRRACRIELRLVGVESRFVDVIALRMCRWSA